MKSPKTPTMSAMVMLTLMTAVLLTGCSTIKPTFITPSGGPVADHYYSLSSTSYPISTIFYYALGVAEKDLDGSPVPELEYLQMFGKHTIVRKDYKGLYLFVYVQNPTELTYTVHRVINKKVGLMYDPSELKLGGPVGKSNKPTRQFILHLPYEENLLEADYTITIEVDGETILTIGPFTYRLVG